MTDTIFINNHNKNNQKYIETIPVLNHLLGRSRDAQKMYVEVSNNINDPHLSKWFLSHTSQREKFAVELENQIRALNGNPIDGGTIGGALHRVWIDLKSYWTDNDLMTLLTETEKGERRALEDYMEVLNHYEMPKMTQVVLEHHANKSQTALENIESLKSLYMPATV